MHSAQIGFLNGLAAFDLDRRAFDQHATLLQHGDAFHQFEQRVHVVVDDDHGAASPNRFEELHHLDAFQRTHAGKRLVEQKQARRARQRKADLEPALFTIGELGDRRVGTPRQMYEFESALDLLGQSGNARHAAEHIEAELAAQRGERGDPQNFRARSDG